MKKLVLFLVVFLVSLSMVFAFSNNQKIWPTDSDVFKAITQLYLITGHSLPSQTGPWSSAELQNMMKLISPDSLNDNEMALYDYVMDELDINPRQPSEGIAIDWSVDVDYEFYAHKNTEQFQKAQDWAYDNLDQKPFVAITFETWPADNFYGYFSFLINNNFNFPTELGETKTAQNIMWFKNFKFDITEMNQNQPYRAFVAAGGDHWTMQIGRDRLNWGAGLTGNLMMSDNFLYHNMFRFTTFANTFKYTYLMSFFPHPQYYTNNGVWINQEAEVHGVAALMSHRLEGSFFEKKLNFTLTESAMYVNETGLDLEYLNPAMFYHDNYIRGNTNSLLGLELDYTPVKGLNVFAEWCMDDFAIGPEPKPGIAEEAQPTAFGYMLGAKYTTATPYGVLGVNYEFAKTDPYLYLRDKGQNTGNQNKGDYGLGYIGAIRHFPYTWEKEFIGYQYGGDAIVNNITVTFANYGKFSAQVSYFNMMHGTFDIDTCWSWVGNGSGAQPTYQGTPTTSHPTENQTDDNANLRDSVAYTNILEIGGEYKVTDSLTVYADLAFMSIKNYKNIKANGTAKDTQLVLGARYSI